MRLRRGVALPSAFLLSFTTYLIPLYHLEAGWLFLGSVWSGLDEMSVLSVAWVAATLLLHGLAIFLFYWFLIRIEWKRTLAIVAAAPLLIIVANVGLLYAIPLLVLAERDRAPEVGALEQVCSIPDASVAQVRSGSDLSLVRAGEVWLEVGPLRSRALLRMPGCTLAALAAPITGSSIDAVAPGGHLLHRSHNGDLLYFGSGRGEPVRLSSPPEVSYWNPILSDDGLVLVWLDRVRVQDGPGAHRLRIRHIDDGREEAIALALPARSQFALVGARSKEGPFTLAQFRNAIFSIDLDGQKLREPVSPDGVYDARWGFRWLVDGWVAWDGYREEGRSRIVWDLLDRRGEMDIPRGHGIDSLAISLDGALIAVSISSNLRIGNTSSSVFVFQTIDGAEIYRRFDPNLTRTNLAFLGARHLAVTRLENRRAVVDVFRLPTP